MGSEEKNNEQERRNIASGGALDEVDGVASDGGDSGAPKDPERQRAEIEQWMEQKIDVPDSINEEYYQISPDILDCFPKFRFPLNLYLFKEDIASLAQFYSAGDRVDGNLRAKIYTFCRDGLLFVSRDQHDIYTDFITRQLDMVLLDKNLLASEIAEIFAKAFIDNLRQFFDQPLPPALDELKKCCSILIEFLVQNIKNVDELVCYTHAHANMETKGVNVAFIALAMYVRYYKGRIKVSVMEKVLLGYLLHDVGMTKVPKFVTDKARTLRVDERRRVQEHPIDGVELLQHLGLNEEEYLLPCLEHHERLDGSGYPQRLKGNEISMIGRITAVADSYTAMITERPFTKDKKPIQAAVELLKDQTAYDPRITTLLVKMLQQISC